MKQKKSRAFIEVAWWCFVIALTVHALQADANWTPFVVFCLEQLITIAIFIYAQILLANRIHRVGLTEGRRLFRSYEFYRCIVYLIELMFLLFV